MGARWLDLELGAERPSALTSVTTQVRRRLAQSNLSGRTCGVPCRAVFDYVTNVTGNGSARTSGLGNVISDEFVYDEDRLTGERRTPEEIEALRRDAGIALAIVRKHFSRTHRK